MLYLHGVGQFHPENTIDNAFLESLDIGIDSKWIMERVGIETRRTVLSRDYIRKTRNADPRASAEASMYSNAQTGARAAQSALGCAGVGVEQIGLVVAGGCSPQWLIPAEACTIAAELGICAPALDINSACSSFVVQTTILDRMRESLPDFVLLINVENTTRAISYNDRRTAILWGDGSAAAVLSPRIPAACALHTTDFFSDPAQWGKVTIRAGGVFDQDGPSVQAFAIRTMAATLGQVRTASAIESEFFVGHQANLRVLESVCRRMNIPPEKHLYNVDQFGNCGAAGAPSVICQHWNQFRSGDAVAICVVGSGVTWGGLWVQFGGNGV